MGVVGALEGEPNPEGKSHKIQDDRRGKGSGRDRLNVGGRGSEDGRRGARGGDSGGRAVQAGESGGRHGWPGGRHGVSVGKLGRWRGASGQAVHAGGGWWPVV